MQVWQATKDLTEELAKDQFNPPFLSFGCSFLFFFVLFEPLSDFLEFARFLH